MTTWYCYKEKIGFYHLVIYEGKVPPLVNGYCLLLWSYWRGTLHPYKMSVGKDWQAQVNSSCAAPAMSSRLRETHFPCVPQRLHANQKERGAKPATHKSKSHITYITSRDIANQMPATSAQNPSIKFCMFPACCFAMPFSPKLTTQGG